MMMPVRKAPSLCTISESTSYTFRRSIWSPPVQHFYGTSGRQSQRCHSGKFPTFAFGCAVSVVMVLIYTHLGHVTLTTAIVVNVLMFVGIFSRMISVTGADFGDSRTQPAWLLQRSEFFRAAVLRRARVGSGRRDHRPECRRFAQAFRLGGLCRRRKPR